MDSSSCSSSTAADTMSEDSGVVDLDCSSAACDVSDPFARIIWQLGQMTSSQERVERALVNLERDSAFMKAVLQKTWARSDSRPNLPLRPSHFTEDATPRVLQRMNSKSTATDVPLGLSASWPSNLQLRRVLESVQGVETELSVGSDYERVSSRLSGRMLRLSERSLQRADSTFSTATSNHSTLRRVMAMRPNSVWRCVIDVISIVLLITDITVQPYVLAWEVSRTHILTTLEFVTALFWTMDIFANFTTGYNNEDRLELRLRRVARKYLRSWFPLDLALVACDWTNIVMTKAFGLEDSVTQNVRIFRLTKLSRLARILGLLRMLRPLRRFGVLLEVHTTEGLVTFMQIGGVLLFMLWMNHLVGCAWYAVGKYSPSDTGTNWLQHELTVDGEQVAYRNMDESFQYLTSLHWALAQTTLGATEVQSTTTVERLVTILLLLLGILVSSTIISSLSASLVSYQLERSDLAKRMRTLRRFIREMGVQSDLAVRVKWQVEQRELEPGPVSEEEVPVLNQLSTSLRVELRLDIFEKHLRLQPFLRLLAKLTPVVSREFCVNALSHRYLGVTDELFEAGTASTSAFLLIQGDLRYVQEPESSLVVSLQEERVARGACISEAAIWLEWVHVGTAVASTASQVVAVCSEACLSICMKHRVIRDLTAQYAVQFQNCVISAVPPRPFPTDLAVPNTEFAEIVISMPESTRKLIGREATSGLSPPRLVAKLRTQLCENSCALLVNSSGKVERIETSVAVQITACDGRILVQLGESDGTKMGSMCMLPGKKFDLTLTAAEVVEEVLADLVSVADCLEILTSEVEVTDEEFSWNQVKARNIRTIFHARLDTEAVNMGRPVFENASVFTRMGTSISQSPLPRVLSAQDIFAVTLDDNIRYYSWLTDREFAVLREPQHDRYVRRFVSSLSLFRGSTMSSASSQLFTLPSRESSSNAPFNGISSSSLSNFAASEESKD